MLRRLRVERLGNDLTDGTTALPTIETAAMMGLHRIRAPRARFNRFAHAFVIDTSADANDHENDVHLVRMIVKNESQFDLFSAPQESGGARGRRLANCANETCFIASR